MQYNKKYTLMYYYYSSFCPWTIGFFNLYCFSSFGLLAPVTRTIIIIELPTSTKASKYIKALFCGVVKADVRFPGPNGSPFRSNRGFTLNICESLFLSLAVK